MMRLLPLPPLVDSMCTRINGSVFYEARITDYTTSPIPNITRTFKVPSINAVEIKHEGRFQHSNMKGLGWG